MNNKLTLQMKNKSTMKNNKMNSESKDVSYNKASNLSSNSARLSGTSSALPRHGRESQASEVQSKKLIKFQISQSSMNEFIPKEKAMLGPLSWKRITNKLIERKKKYCFLIKATERKQKLQFYEDFIKVNESDDRAVGAYY